MQQGVRGPESLGCCLYSPALFIKRVLSPALEACFRTASWSPQRCTVHGFLWHLLQARLSDPEPRGPSCHCTWGLCHVLFPVVVLEWAASVLGGQGEGEAR